MAEHVGDETMGDKPEGSASRGSGSDGSGPQDSGLGGSGPDGSDVGVGGASVHHRTLTEAAAMGPLPGTAELNAMAERGEDDSSTEPAARTAKGALDGPIVVVPYTPRS